MGRWGEGAYGYRHVGASSVSFHLLSSGSRFPRKLISYSLLVGPQGQGNRKENHPDHTDFSFFFFFD